MNAEKIYIMILNKKKTWFADDGRYISRPRIAITLSKHYLDLNDSHVAKNHEYSV